MSLKEIPEAITNTLEITDKCEFNLATGLGYTLPDPAVPTGYTADSYLKRLCSEAAQRRYGTVTSEVEARLDEEFHLIGRHRLAGFLLLYREIVFLAQKIMEEKGAGPPGDPPGGEAAGSGARLVSGLAGGVPHRHQPRRPSALGPHTGAFHPRGHDHAPRYRPGLPSIPERRANRAGAPALRPRVRRADRGRVHLLGEGDHPGTWARPWACRKKDLRMLSKQLHSHDARDLRGEMLELPSLSRKGERSRLARPSRSGPPVDARTQEPWPACGAA